MTPEPRSVIELLGPFDPRRALRLISHNVRTRAVRLARDGRATDIHHAFYLLRNQWR